MSERLNFRCLDGNVLKIIAAVTMLIDHAGMIFFPQYDIFRIIGRLSFPIFAFMIAEGCKYTKSKLKYFMSVFILAFLCQTVYFFLFESLYMSVLVSFSLSILSVYSLQFAKKMLKENGRIFAKVLSVALFFSSVAAIYVFNTVLNIDYGFFGCMLPVFASLIEDENDLPIWLKKADLNTVRVLIFGIGLLFMASYYGGIRYFSLFSLPILMMYSGRRGKWKLKYFFYIFYPAHLAILYGIDMLI